MAPDLSQTCAAVERLAAKATPGPWATTRAQRIPDAHGAVAFPPDVMICAVARGQGVYATPPGGSFPAADQDFIAYMRDAAPALVAALREAERREAGLRALADKWHRRGTDFTEALEGPYSDEVRYAYQNCEADLRRILPAAGGSAGA